MLDRVRPVISASEKALAEKLGFERLPAPAALLVDLSAGLRVPLSSIPERRDSREVRSLRPIAIVMIAIVAPGISVIFMIG